MNRRFARGWQQQLIAASFLDGGRAGWCDEAQHRPRGTIAAARSGRGTVLLDVASNRYINLNGVGSKIWTALETCTTFDEIVAGVQNEYVAVDEATVATDTRSFIGSLQRQGLLTAQIEPKLVTHLPLTSARRSGTSAAGRVAARLLAPPATALTFLLLRLAPLRRSIGWLRVLRRLTRPDRVDPSLVADVVRWTRPSGVFRTERLMCLENSLAAATVCTLMRQDIRWCIGVVRAPFGAHAWIEAEGRPVADVRAEHCDTLITS